MVVGGGLAELAIAELNVPGRQSCLPIELADVQPRDGSTGAFLLLLHLHRRKRHDKTVSVGVEELE